MMPSHLVDTVGHKMMRLCAPDGYHIDIPIEDNNMPSHRHYVDPRMLPKPKPYIPKGKAQTLARKIRATTEWKELSAAILRDRVWCADPFRAHHGKALAECVHHIMPVDVYPERAFDVTNLQALCLECHKRIHTAEAQGDMNAVRRATGRR